MKTLGIAVLLLTVSLNNAFAQTAIPADMAVKTKIHAVPSQTLSDEQLLTGTSGKDVVVGGELRIPQGKGPFPAVVLMHGSSGIGSNVDPWVRQLNGDGIATFVLDSITGRGFTQLGDQQDAVGRLNFIVDIYGALDILAHDTQIDPNRIGLIGFSRGGQAALYASLERLNKTWNKSGAKFNNYVAFYPNCITKYIDDTKVENAPIRVFHGGADNYNPPDVCETYVERLKKDGADVEMTTYAGGHHGFDFPSMFGQTVVSKSAQSAGECNLEESGNGQIINIDTGKPFAYTDSCVKIGPNVGGNTDIAQQSHAAVQTFLKKQFGL